MESEVYKRKVDTRDELLSRIFGCCCLHEDVKINSEEQHTIFSHEVQSALRVTVGFPDVYCELK
jgi:hypothetical protein